MTDDHRGLTYDDFRRRALDETRTNNEKIGFPDSYRAGTEQAIFDDILAKVPNLRQAGATVIDIGCGCGPLAQLMISHCAKNGQRLTMVDSAEMLDLLPPDPHVQYWPLRFPDERFLKEFSAKADAAILYSVIQHEFASGDLWGMFDGVCALLGDGGRALLGDVPNRSMRTRLFNSANGLAYHRAFTGTDTPPPIPPYGLVPGEIDDTIVISLLMRARSQGLHAYVLPQPDELPFFNRREDILLQHP